MYGDSKDPEQPKKPWEKKKQKKPKLEVSHYPISNYIYYKATEQYGSGIKTDIDINGTEVRPQKSTHTYLVN